VPNSNISVLNYALVVFIIYLIVQFNITFVLLLIKSVMNYNFFVDKSIFYVV